jgi:hypothetical protein
MTIATEMTGRELVTIDPQRYDAVNLPTYRWLKTLTDVEQQLVTLTSVPEIKDIINLADLAKNFAEKAKDTHLVERAIEVQREAQRRAGELLKAMKTRGELYDGLVPPNRRSQSATVQTLKEIGVTKTESSRWQRLAAAPKDEFDAETERCQAKATAAMTGEKPATYQNSADEEYYTPSEIVEAARRAMGSIDLDPASCASANEVVQAATFYTRDDNGLLQTWEGNVFCNPPYSRKRIDEFVERLIHFYDEGDITAAVFLTSDNTDTRWFQRLMGKAAAICFPEGRLNWWSTTNSGESNALRGSAIFYLGPEPETFRMEFRKFGHVVKCWE